MSEALADALYADGATGLIHEETDMLATAALAWLTAELGSDEMREAVERAIREAAKQAIHEGGHDDFIPEAAAALAAITARLTGQGEA